MISGQWQDPDGLSPDERIAVLKALDLAARSLAPSLVGLTVSEAQWLVDQQPGLTVEFRRPGNQGHRSTPVRVVGRIYAVVADGMVTRAS